MVGQHLNHYFRATEVDKNTENKNGFFSFKTSWDRNSLKYQRVGIGPKRYIIKYVSVDRRTLVFSSSYEVYAENKTRFDGGYGICEVQETVERKF